MWHAQAEEIRKGHPSISTSQGLVERSALLESAGNFCDALANKKPIDKMLSFFSATNDKEIKVFEHGLQKLAPFLGRKFTGRDGAKEYFSIISECLDYENMLFSDYIVDAHERVVSVRGHANFTWKSTGNTWHETFVYRLKMDLKGKILVYDVWADTGAAYLASKGELSS